MTTTEDPTPTRLAALRHHWDGAPRSGDGSRTIPRHDPADGSPLGEVPCAEPIDVNAAVAVARRATPAWGGLAAADRSQLLHEAADRV